MIAPGTIDTELLEIIGHLGAALMQTIESDDQIIMGHVRDAHTLASALRRQIVADARGISADAPEARVIAIGDHDPEYILQQKSVAHEMGKPTND